METRNTGSTIASYEEVWEVTVGREVFELNEKQIAALKKEETSGTRGLIWFDGFAISIPHIQSIYRKGKRPTWKEGKVIRYEQVDENTVRPIYE